jgi:tetratricopeptide (TPR) repeat protein
MSEPTNESALRDLFDQAIELAPDERAVFLAQACGEGIELRLEVEALLLADSEASAETFWEHSAVRNQAIADGSPSSAIGDIVGQYRLMELIGKGGMGAVYRAVRIDDEFEKCVAVKLIGGLFHSAEVIRHFRAERQILAGLEHPNIARLLDGGARLDGSPYLIMEYVEGVSPYDFCRQRNLSIAQRLILFRQICSAVHFAHQRMVIHRDLKPANILVTEDGSPKLLDFGIAKVLNPDPLRSGEALTELGMLKLTARYASPEQIRGEAVTTASDVYSLGVILYELLTSHSPYGDDDIPTHRLMSAVCDEEPARPSVRMPKLKGDLDNIILLALRKQPLERYSSADQFSEDILRFVEGRPVLARGDAPLYVTAKFIRRHRIILAAAVLLLFFLVGGLIEVALARARADRRFNEVRQLAHSVIFDYADAIDQLPGSTPVRARMVKDALTYLDNLSKEADTPQLQREIVDAYVRVSDVQGNEYENNLGDTASALASAQKAVSAAERLLKQDQSLPALDSAASAFSTDGSLLYSSGDLPSADRGYQRTVGLRRQIAQQSPRDIANKIALATCLSHLGDLYGGYGFQNMGKTPESLGYYAQAKALANELTATYPNNVDVAKESYETLLSSSSAEGASGRHDDAARDLIEALAQIEKVSTLEPHDTNVKLELANGESRLGQMMIDNRDAAGATPHLARAAGLLQTLSLADPANTMFRRGASIVESQWAAALRGAGKAPEGLVHNETALQLAQALSNDAPDSTQYHVDVGITERKLSEGLLAAGETSAALHHAGQAVQILCSGGSSNPNTLINCGRSELAAGNAYLALHDPKAAEPALRRAEKIASSLSQADPMNAVMHSDAARAQAALAAALAQSGDEQSARTMYAKALASWSILRQTKSISAEDAHRSDEAAMTLAHLSSSR